MNEIMVRIRFQLPSLPRAEKVVAEALLENPEAIANFTLSGLAHETGSSDASIVRFCKRMGYSGYTEFKQAFLSAANEESSERPEKIEAQDDMVTILKKVFHSNMQTLTDTLSLVTPNYEKALNAMANAKSIHFFGVGDAYAVCQLTDTKISRMGINCSAYSDVMMQLMTAANLKPYPISLDNYFVDREKTPKDEKGDYDYESLYALDLEFFNKQLQDLLHGKEVELPRFNFTTGRREFKGDKLKIDDNMILILEGIHALNPELTPHIPAENKYKIYVSALTTILLDNHNYIPTTDNRLLRRIIRDHKYRGYSAEETIRRWPSVRAGEEKWIFPYQENADAMFNSALLFELAIMKDYAIPILRNVPNNKPEYSEAYRLRKFLEYFASVQDKELPPTSLLREFLGGSSFRY